MVDVPTLTPVTMPLVLLTVATPVLLVVHTPPDRLFVNDIALPVTTVDAPEIAGTLLTTVTVVVA